MRALGLHMLVVVLVVGCGGSSASSPPHGFDPSALTWAPGRGRECHPESPYHGACQGPRRVPVAQGAAATRAHALGLGTSLSVSRVMVGTPLPTWVAAVHSPVTREMQWPVDGGRLFRGFGYVRRSLPGLRHDGVDISAPVGTRILAAADGLVVYADNGVQGYGNFLAILHANGTTTFYAHCRAIFVAAGELVRRGQIVAEVGLTGITRGPHLHFEWHVHGHPTDPLPRLVRP